MMAELIEKSFIEKYAAYKDSGVEWLGEVPEHWDVLPNRSLFAERNEAGNDQLPILSVSIHTAVSTDELEDEENIRGKIRIKDKSNYKRVYPKDIAFNMMRAWQGAIGVVRNEGMVSPAYIVAKIIGSIDGDYLEYQYRTDAFIQQMDRYSKGITDFRKRLYWNEFKQLITVVPPKDEQLKIVGYLDRKTAMIDKAIAIKEKQIELLKERQRILVYYAVNHGLNPSVKMKKSGVEWIGKIPEDWRLMKLKYCFDINNGADYKHVESKDGYPVIGSGGPFAFASDFMYDGEVLLLGRKGTVDKPQYFKGKFWVVDTIFYAVPKSNSICRFLFFVATTIPFNRYSTATAIPSMTQTDLNNHKVALPPIEIQLQIVNYIEKILAKSAAIISLKEKEIEKLNEYKVAIIHSAVTGKIKVC